MNKRGQVTVLIILAIVVVLGISLFFIFKGSSGEKGRQYFEEQGLTPSVNNIQDFIKDCLETNAKDALIDVGIRGGYFTRPPRYFEMQWAFIPYYYDQGEFLQPSKEQIELELAAHVDFNIESCISEIDFNNFNIEYEPSSTKAEINPNTVTFTSKLPTIIKHKRNSITFDLDQHPITFNSSLKDILDVATFITESHKEDPDLICINCITELAKEKKLYVDFIAFEPDTTLIMILENRTMEQPYLFEFLNRYDLN